MTPASRYLPVNPVYRRLFLLLAVMLAGLRSEARIGLTDTAYIRQFERRNSVEIYSGMYNTQFNFTNYRDSRNDYRLTVNRSGFVGADISYKWVYLEYSVNIPGTQLDAQTKFKYRSLRFKFGNNRMNVQPFFNSYNGLLIPQANRREFGVVRDIDITHAGLDFYYYTNSNKFSARAASSFSQHQIRSAGAVFLVLTPLWQQIQWENPNKNLIRDTATYQLLASNPSWISLITKIGYTYNFSLGRRHWLIAPALTTGGGALREMNTEDTRLKPIISVQAWLNAGYSNQHFYVYAHAFWHNLSAHLLLRNMDRRDWGYSITAGRRFRSLPKKILGIL